MSDFSSNNTEFANFISMNGKSNSLKNISTVRMGSFSSPGQIGLVSPSSTLREPTRKIRQKTQTIFNGTPLNTQRPQIAALPVPPSQALVICITNQNICGNDQQICSVDYYQ